MKGKKYALLQKEMVQQDLTRKELGYHLNLSESAITSRLIGRQDWRDSEQYKVLDFLGLPHNKKHLYVPPNGIDEDAAPEPIDDSLSPNDLFIIMAERCIQLARHYGKESPQ